MPCCSNSNFSLFESSSFRSSFNLSLRRRSDSPSSSSILSSRSLICLMVSLRLCYSSLMRWVRTWVSLCNLERSSSSSETPSSRRFMTSFSLRSLSRLLRFFASADSTCLANSSLSYSSAFIFWANAFVLLSAFFKAFLALSNWAPTDWAS